MQAAQKTVLITGANKGIGFEVAKQLGKAGWKVLTAARKEELGREAVEKLKEQGIDAHFVLIDLDRPETAKSAAETIRTRFGAVNVLINNAGIAGGLQQAPSKVEADVLESVLRTNFIGAVMVTQAMLPLLEGAAGAQVVNVSSELGSVSLHNDPTWKYAPVKYLAYCASKAALNMFTVQLAYELRDRGVAVNSVNPGYTATDLNQNSGTQTVEEGAAEIVRVALLDPPVNGKYLENGGEIPW